MTFEERCRLSEQSLPNAPYRDKLTALHNEMLKALAQPEPMAVYGYCPECGAKGVMRERRPNGNDKCANGHTYPSSTSTPPQRKEDK